MISLEVLFLLTLLATGLVASPSEIDSFSMDKNYASRENEVRDSHLERVHVKQETGFDGKVRSIRFSFEAEQDKANEGSRHPANLNVHPIGASYNQNNGQPIRRMSRMEEAPRELISPTSTKASRSKRATEKQLADNELDDLQTAEAKVFRPLFVYRQQVSRRLRLQNDRRSNNNRRQILSRNKPYFRRYYYPYYRYSPYFL